jgi:hypothetical protein
MKKRVIKVVCIAIAPVQPVLELAVFTTVKDVEQLTVSLTRLL